MINQIEVVLLLANHSICEVTKGEEGNFLPTDRWSYGFAINFPLFCRGLYIKWGLKLKSMGRLEGTTP